MPQDISNIGVRYKGNTSYGDITIPVKGNDLRQKFQSPLVLMAGKAGAYDGDKPYNEAEGLTMSFRQVTDHIVRFVEFDVQQNNDGTAAAESAAGSTTLEVDASSAPFLRELEVLKFTLEDIRVRIVSIAGTTLTIERLVDTADKRPGTVTPAGVVASSDVTIPSGAEFINLGRAVSNLSSSLKERNYNAVEERSAALQINRADITLPRRRKVQEQNDRSKQTMYTERQKQELFYTMRDLEKNFMFGAMTRDSLGRVNTTGDDNSTAAADADKFSTSDGIFNVIETYAPQNVLTAASIGATGGGAIDMDLANKYMKYIDDRIGQVDHVHLCSSAVFAKIGEAAQNIPGVSYDIPFAESSRDKTTGHHIKTLNTQFGPMTFMIYPLFNGKAKYNNLILSIRKERLELLALKGGEFQWNPGSEENDLDGERGYFIADVGLVLSYAQEHFILEGLTV